jgi:signal transduction histidine kinase
MARAAASRRANTYLRLGATISIALMLHIFIHMEWVWIWGGLHRFDPAVRALDRPSDHRRPRRDHSRLAAGGPGDNALPDLVVFGALSLPLFASSRALRPDPGRHAAGRRPAQRHRRQCQPAVGDLSAAAPHVFYLLIAPFVAKAVNPDAPLANALWLGALLLIASVAVASRTLGAALKAEADAKEEAERRRHEAEEAVAAKSAFVAMISHELRTPISAILAGAARLHSEVPEASSKVHAQLIGDAGGLMRTLLNDLLDFSRLEAGRMAVEKAPFNLRQALSDTLRLWRLEWPRRACACGSRARRTCRAGWPATACACARCSTTCCPTPSSSRRAA